MRKHAKKFPCTCEEFLVGTKSFLCACKSLYYFFYVYIYILGTVYVVTSRKSMEKKNPEKLKIFTDD